MSIFGRGLRASIERDNVNHKNEKKHHLDFWEHTETLKYLTSVGLSRTVIEEEISMREIAQKKSSQIERFFLALEGFVLKKFLKKNHSDSETE